MAKKLIIAHRGASAYAPENTLGAFKAAIEMGADMIEFDVRKTKDNVLVLNHDPTYFGQGIAKLTCQELMDMSVSQVPLLKQALEYCKDRIKLDIEIKEEGYEKFVVDTIKEYFSEKDFRITSFSSKVILKVKHYNPTLEVGLILDTVHGSWHGKFLDLFINRDAICASDLLVVHYSRIKCGLFKNSFYKRNPLYVYTVDKPERIKKLLKLKAVTGIITNKPDLALSFREK